MQSPNHLLHGRRGLQAAHFCPVLESNRYTLAYCYGELPTSRPCDFIRITQWRARGTLSQAALRVTSSATLHSQLHGLSQSPLSHCIHSFVNKNLRVLLPELCWGLQIPKRRHGLCPLRECQAKVMNVLRIVVCVHPEWQSRSSNLYNVYQGPTRYSVSMWLAVCTEEL